jgi:Dullard-like phosphatase family protein
MIKKPSRREKSFTVLSPINKNLIEDELNINIKENNNNESFNSSKSKSNIEENAENNQKKNSTGLNTSNNKLNRSGVRQNSTRDLIRESNNKEKITALTNKQTIENINEYIRQCLEIIPDLLELGDKMPRIKTRVNPNFPKDKKIALFDLDETIVHCIGEKNINNIESLSRQSDAKIKVCLPGGKKEVTVGINIRPHWKEALNKIKKKYHIIAFTASHESYADSVLNYLDPDNNYFEYRLYRCHCVLCVIEEMKFYVKDLKILEDNYDLKDVVIIDNSVLSFAYHLDNGIPISPFYDSKDDSELLDIADFLLKYGDENDIRDKLKEVYKLNQYLEILKNYSSNENEDSSDSVDEEENNGEKTNKNININKNSSNINLNHPLIENKIKIDINNKNENKDVDENDNKNISQVNLKLKEISELFTNNDKKEKSDNNIYHKPKFIEHQATDSLNKNIDNYRNTKKEKHKTIRFEFNFKKEWDKKQKELKNQ